MNAESARLRRKPIAITTVIAASLNTAFSWAETLSAKGVEMRSLAVRMADDQMGEGKRQAAVRVTEQGLALGDPID